jgi:phosphomannomutase
MNREAFREYDIRGIVERDFDDDFVTDLGRAYAAMLHRAGKRSITLGRDCRPSSPRRHDCLLEGIVSSGIDVTDVGVVPTPLLYFSVLHWKMDGGVVAALPMKQLGLDVEELYVVMDGRFPNHHHDPTVEENMRDLREAVTRNGAELRIAYDGDADRIGAVDGAGRIIWGDELMVVFSRAIQYFRKSHDVIDIDGVRVNFGDGWGLVRASNTQPAVAMRFEAANPARLGEIRTIFEDKLREFGAM